MEERIIDDEYGRGIRLKKTKDGFVDATDERAEEPVDEATETATEDGEEFTEEVTFEFPDLSEDDEDLVNLSPEEAIALRKKKEEEAAALAEPQKANVLDYLLPALFAVVILVFIVWYFFFR